MSTSRKLCFLVSPIGDDGSDVRKRADAVLDDIVTPAVKPLGYVVVRADRIRTPGLLILQICELLIGAELVIADLTDDNVNVYYELGIRHAIGRQALQLAERGKTLAFDIAGVRTVFIDTTTTSGIEQSIRELRIAVGAAEAAPDVSSPVATLFSVTVATRSADHRGRDLIERFVDSTRREKDLATVATPFPAKPLSSLKWNIEFTRFFDKTLELLPPNADDAVSRLLWIVANHAGDTPALEGMNLRLVKSNSYALPNGSIIPPLRLYFTVEDETALMLIVEEDDRR